MADDKLAEARARLEAAKTKAAAEKASRDEAGALRNIEREIRETEAIAAACAQYGESAIAVLSTDAHGVLVVRRPLKVHYRAWETAAVSGKAREEDYYAYVRPHVVYPEGERFEAIIDEIPAVLDSLAIALNRLAGVGQGEQAKK